MENKLKTVSNSLNYLYNVYANYLQTRKIKTNDKDSAVKGNIQQFWPEKYFWPTYKILASDNADSKTNE